MKKVILFYIEGFRSMTIGKSLWTIILIKIFILFFILRLFFFPNLLKENFTSDKERSAHVIERLTERGEVNSKR